MLEDTIFHKIVRKEIPADILYEDEDVLVFKDINPKATTHLILIAKKEKDFVPSIAELTKETENVPLMLIRKAQKFADEHGIRGYKLIFNVGKGGGQEIFYLHLHLISQEHIRN